MKKGFTLIELLMLIAIIGILISIIFVNIPEKKDTIETNNEIDYSF